MIGDYCLSSLVLSLVVSFEVTSYLVSSQDGVHALGVEARGEVATHASEAPTNVAEAVLDEHVLVHTVAD